MSGRITADLARLDRLATSLDGLAQQVEALRGNLTKAVAPALRGDVPEFWTISAQSSGTSGALRDLAGGLRSRAGAVRHYRAAMVQVETVLALLRYRLALGTMSGSVFRPFGSAGGVGAGRGPGLDAATAQLRKDMAALGIDIARDGAVDLMPGLPRTAGKIDLDKGIGFLGAKSLALKNVLILYGIGENVHGMLDQDKAAGERFGHAVDATAATAGGSAVLLEAMGLGGGAVQGTLSKVAGRLGWAGLAYQATYITTSYWNRGFEADEAAGRSSTERINQTFVARSIQLGRAPGGHHVAAAELGGQYVTLGVRKGSQAIARRVYPETTTPDPVDPHTAAQLLAGLQQLNPDAQLIPLHDGRFIVKVRNDGIVDSFFIDNERLTIR